MSPKVRWSAFRSSFQLRIFIAFTLLSAFFSIFICTLYINSEIHEKSNNIHEQTLLQARQLANAIPLSLYSEASEVLQHHAEEAVRSPEIVSVVIISVDGRVLAAARAQLSSDSQDTIRETAEVRSNPLAHTLETAISGTDPAERPLLGSVTVERSTHDLSKMIAKLVTVSSGIAAISWLTITIFCYLLLRRVTASFNALMCGIEAMREGDYSHLIEIKSDDEPGRAAQAINCLADELRRRGEDNARLHEERLDLERQMLYAQKLESLGVMAGGIAHDYNNLLQSILGNIEMAALELAPESPAHRYINNAIDSGRQAAHLTSLMLTYAGKGMISRKELNLNELVRENADMLRMSTSSTVTIKTDLHPELPWILADTANIQQVVMNLVINAAEAISSPSGTISITTGTRECDQDFFVNSRLEEKAIPGRYVFLEVADNGCGMNEETLKSLFDPFFTTKFTGRGLGLSAVIGIIRTHGGALFVESEPGVGSTFRVFFPASDAPPSAVAPPAAVASKRSATAGVALLVDDEKSVLRVCTVMLKHCGYSVITATDGVEAVARFREHEGEINLVLMDLTMPNMDGITAMDEIFKIRPDVKVIISSGFNEQELSDRIQNPPPSGFIRKPYNISALATEIERVMAND